MYLRCVGRFSSQNLLKKQTASWVKAFPHDIVNTQTRRHVGELGGTSRPTPPSENLSAPRGGYGWGAGTLPNESISAPRSEFGWGVNTPPNENLSGGFGWGVGSVGKQVQASNTYSTDATNPQIGANADKTVAVTPKGVSSSPEGDALRSRNNDVTFDDNKGEKVARRTEDVKGNDTPLSLDVMQHIQRLWFTLHQQELERSTEDFIFTTDVVVDNGNDFSSGVLYSLLDRPNPRNEMVRHYLALVPRSRLGENVPTLLELLGKFCPSSASHNPVTGRHALMVMVYGDTPESAEESTANATRVAREVEEALGIKAVVAEFCDDVYDKHLDSGSSVVMLFDGFSFTCGLLANLAFCFPHERRALITQRDIISMILRAPERLQGWSEMKWYALAELSADGAAEPYYGDIMKSDAILNCPIVYEGGETSVSFGQVRLMLRMMSSPKGREYFVPRMAQYVSYLVAVFNEHGIKERSEQSDHVKLNQWTGGEAACVALSLLVQHPEGRRVFEEQSYELPTEEGPTGNAVHMLKEVDVALRTLRAIIELRDLEERSTAPKVQKEPKGVAGRTDDYIDL